MREISLALILLCSGLVSCDVIDRYGCTDFTAENYDDRASREDYSCVYKAEGMLYWDQYTYQWLDQQGVSIINIKVENEIVASNIDIHSLNYNEPPQSCVISNWPGFETLISQNSSNPVHVQMLDQANTTVLSTVINMYAGCSNYQITHY